MIIYKATNLKNGKVYIGQTTRDLEIRMKEHLTHRKTAFDKAYKKSEIDNFKIEIIDRTDTIEKLNEKEKYWIEYYNCIVPNGYNMCEGGDNTVGFHHKEESKRKMSISKSKLYMGENNPFFGKTHSKESKEKMSKLRKGMAHLTDEQKKKLKDSHLTRKVMNVDTKEIFKSVKEAAEKYNLKATHISRVCRGKRKTTGGFRWEYIIHDDTVPSLKETIGRCND